MRPTRFPLLLLLSLLLTILSIPATALADDETEGDEYDVDARVVRISLISGDVSLRRHDTEDWEAAKLNTPLVEGDMLATASGGRAEIQIDARNFLRLASDSVIKIVTLRNEGVALSLSKGTATLRLARFDKDHEYFEIDAPQTTIAAEAKGVYRLEAESKGTIRVTVREGGVARVYSDSAGFTVRDGHSATLAVDGTTAGDWQIASAGGKDDWDDWVNDREKYLASRLKYDQNMRYYEADLWGAEDLDSYGNWTYANDYGWIWQPNITVINTYNDWAPYRYGEWVWCAPYGWTWVGEEPWGWAPYHFGRWVYYNNYWAWCPHSYYRPHHSWWRPALVAFFSIDFNFGNYCWYPLSYHQRDPRSKYYEHHRDRLTPMRADEIANLRRRNPALFRAVTSVQARDLGNRGARPQRANDEVARRAVGGQPLREGLPVRPSTGSTSGTNGGNRGGRPGPAIAARPTGAAPRTPGVPLDTELRRTRIFNGRDPISLTPPAGSPRAVDTGTTGAIARPARPADPNRSPEPRRNPEGGAAAPVERTRPARSREGGTAQPAPIVEPTRQERPPAETQPERRVRPNEPAPVRPPRPERTEQPAPTTETPVSHPAPPPQRSEPPPRRSESPPQRSEPPPQRSEPPPQRSEPPPQRSEPPPQRSAPPPQRSEPPPQRSEPPPQRSEPPPQRSAPPERSEPSKPARPSEARERP